MFLYVYTPETGSYNNKNLWVQIFQFTAQFPNFKKIYTGI